jgi:hypothetical protein
MLLKIYQLNLFSGNIPPEIGKLTMLQYLFLYNNYTFSGSIPPEIGNLKELLSLDLSGNQFSGPLPPTLWNLTNLQTLNLFLNNINGKIPQTISNITSLTSINLFGNNLSGSIPSDFGKYMPSLAYASFSDNSFSGELPPELCSGMRLHEFTVNRNNFTGLLPTCLRNCSEITRVRFEENRFTGNITDAFGVLPNLVLFASVTINLLVKSHQIGENVKTSPIYRWTETEFLVKSPLSLRSCPSCDF